MNITRGVCLPQDQDPTFLKNEMEENFSGHFILLKLTICVLIFLRNYAKVHNGGHAYEANASHFAVF